MRSERSHVDTIDRRIWTVASRRRQIAASEPTGRQISYMHIALVNHHVGGKAAAAAACALMLVLGAGFVDTGTA